MLFGKNAQKDDLTVSCHSLKTAKTGCFWGPLLEPEQEFSGLSHVWPGSILTKVARVFRVWGFSRFKRKSRDGGHFIIRQMGAPTPKTSRTPSENTFLNFRVDNLLDPAYFQAGIFPISELTLWSEIVGHSGARNYYWSILWKPGF